MLSLFFLIITNVKFATVRVKFKKMCVKITIENTVESLLSDPLGGVIIKLDNRSGNIAGLN